MAQIYDFKTQLQVGETGEGLIDKVIDELGFESTPASYLMQTQGIDRIILTDDGIIFTAEYKTDTLAHKTGNAFIEFIVGERPGWAVGSYAQYLFYLILNTRQCHMIPMTEIKKRLVHWRHTYNIKTCHNKDYISRGILVPLDEIRKIATITLKA